MNRTRKDSAENARVLLLLVRQSRCTVRHSERVLQIGTVTRYAPIERTATLLSQQHVQLFHTDRVTRF